MTTPSCLAPEVLAAYVDGSLPEPEARAAERHALSITESALELFAGAGRGTPREALALFSRVADAAAAERIRSIDRSFVQRVFEDDAIVDVRARNMEVAVNDRAGAEPHVPIVRAIGAAPNRKSRNEWKSCV